LKVSNRSRSPSNHKLGLRHALEARQPQTPSRSSAERILSSFFWRDRTEASEGALEELGSGRGSSGGLGRPRDDEPSALRRR